MSEDVHWLEVDKETGEIYRFYVTDYGLSNIDDDAPVVLVPCRATDMIDVPTMQGQLYDFDTGKTLDSDISWNNKLKFQLTETDWIATRHRDQQDLGVNTTLTDEEYKEFLEWRESLRRDMR
jgi:hypothetical protein